MAPPDNWKTGYYGYAYLESPGNAENGIDDDLDGMVDERRDDGIDNDGDWSPFLDLNGNGVWDADANELMKGMDGVSRSHDLDETQPPKMSQPYSGLHIGTDNAAWAIDNYTLAGEMWDVPNIASTDCQYMDGSHVERSAGTGITTAEFWRPIMNTSGGNLAVEECGLLINGDAYRVLIARQLTGSIVLPDKYSLTILGKLQVTV